MTQCYFLLFNIRDLLAEREGFRTPDRVAPMLAFRVTVHFDHSATSPGAITGGERSAPFRSGRVLGEVVARTRPGAGANSLGFTEYEGVETGDLRRRCPCPARTHHKRIFCRGHEKT